VYNSIDYFPDNFVDYEKEVGSYKDGSFVKGLLRCWEISCNPVIE
jgi:hypothetical protein